MERYRIIRGEGCNGCIPIIIYWVQVRKDKRISYEWVNVKGFDTYKRAKELLNVLKGGIDYEQIEVKNYIHNELKLTKEDIKDIVVSIVKEEVKRIFHNTYGDDVNIERWIRCMVSDEIKKNGDYLMIRNLCREIIKEEIVDRLSIDISLKKKEE